MSPCIHVSGSGQGYIDLRRVVMILLYVVVRGVLLRLLRLLLRVLSLPTLLRSSSRATGAPLTLHSSTRDHGAKNRVYIYCTVFRSVF